MTNAHITRPPESVSFKSPWSEFNRGRFEAELLRLGWVYAVVQGECFLGRQMPDERRWIKGDKALMVDDFGAFLFQFIVNPNYLDGVLGGNWQRVDGISDDAIDASPEGYLHFDSGRKLDLKKGKWFEG